MIVERMNSVATNFPIQDIREMDEFKTSSFTGYKKTEVKNKIIHCLLDSKLEEICYWTAEFVAAGHFVELWDICFYFLGKHIHLGNPLLAVYIKKKYDIFRVMANEQLYQQNPLNLRNNSTIRELLAEVFCTMALSDKKHSYEELKIHEIADVSHIVNHLRADHSDYATYIIHHNDPHEWTIAINEFGYHISNPESYNMNLACFWVEWMIEFDALCKKRKQPLLCEKRIDYPELESKFRGEFIWIVWETILYYAQRRGDLEYILVNTLFQLFRVRYTSVTVKKRKPLIYFAISILTENNPCLKREILNENAKNMVAVAVENVHDIIYKPLKKNEIHSKDSFDRKELEKLEANQKRMESIHKLQILNQNDMVNQGSSL